MIRARIPTDSHTGAFRLVAGFAVAAVMMCALMPPAVQHQHLLAEEEALPAALHHGSRDHTHPHRHRHAGHHGHHHQHAVAPTHNADESDANVANGRTVRHWHYLLFGFNVTIETPDSSPSPLPDDRPDAVHVSSVSIDAPSTPFPATFQVGHSGVLAGLSAPVVVAQRSHPPPLQSMHGPPLCHAAELLRSGVRIA